MFDATDNLRLCKNCADYETTSPDGICSHCKEQSMIDDSVPTPFDWSVWDDDADDEEDGWTDDDEEELLRWGICPECGAELDICGHGDPELDGHWGSVDDDDID